MRGDLCCVGSSLILFREMFFNLLAARTRRREICFGIARDFRLSALPTFDFVAQPFVRFFCFFAIAGYAFEMLLL